MTDRSLSSLYRRLSAQRQDPAHDLLDADTLVAAAAGTLRGDRRDEVAARLSRSDLQTDLVRLLRDLAPAAEALADGIGARERSGHRRGSRTLQHAHAARSRPTLRWAGLAACLVVALGALGLHQHRVQTEEAAMAAAMEAASRPDRIFTSVDRIFSAPIESASGTDAADGVFRSNFNGG